MNNFILSKHYNIIYLTHYIFHTIYILVFIPDEYMNHSYVQSKLVI